MSTPTRSPWQKQAPPPPTVSGGAPLVGHALEFMRDPHQVIRRGYAEHGPVFSVDLGRKKAVFLVGPEYHKFFFRETDRIFSIRQGYETLMKMFDKGMLFFAHLTEYQEQMKVLMPLFQNNDRFTGLMVEEVDDFMENVLGEQGEIDVTEAFGPLVMHVAARAFFGEEFRRKLGAEYFDVFRTFALGADVVLPSWLPLPKFRRSAEAKHRIESMIYDLIQERRRHPLEPKDLFQEFIESTYYGGKPLPERLVVSILLFIPWAGHETTVGHTGWTLIELLRHEGYLARVQAELSEVLGEAQLYSSENLKKLKTLDWAIKETERMHPAAHMYMRGVRDDFDIDGYEVAEGSMVFVVPEVAHRLPEVFEDPDRYDPLRFAPDRAEDATAYSLIGFGGGVHRCAGVNFAKLEMKIIMAKLLQNYDITLLDKNPKPKPGTQTKWPESPCRIRYLRR